MDQGRDMMRAELNRADQESFPLVGTKGTDIRVLIETMLHDGVQLWSRQYSCTSCSFSNRIARDATRVHNISIFQCSPLQWSRRVVDIRKGRLRTTEDWINANLREITRFTCASCASDMIKVHKYTTLPVFLSFQVSQKANVKWTHTVELQRSQYRLCGMIYFGRFHFTARIISAQGDVWFHDGMQANRSCIYEGNMGKILPKSLMTDPQGRRISFALYVQC